MAPPLACLFASILATSDLPRAQANVTRVELINVGMPKSGSSSLFNFLKCATLLRASHWSCSGDEKRAQLLGASRLSARRCGPCIRSNVINMRPPFEGCGDYNAYTQLDFSDPTGLDPTGLQCTFPQVTFLEILTAHHPGALFTMLTRPSDDWESSVWRWKEPLSPASFYTRFRQCNLPYLPLGLDHNVSLTQIYDYHTAAVRTYFARRTELRFFEGDIRINATGVGLAQALGLADPAAVAARCWRQVNKNDVRPP